MRRRRIPLGPSCDSCIPWQQRQNKKAAGYGVADFLCHDDRFLHSADVYLEKYIPGNANSRRIGNHHWVSALVRIVVCLLPQNRWCSDNGNQKLSIIRNTVFAVTGIDVLILYALSGNAHDYHLTRMVAAILISFGCYLPVTLMSKKHPKVGLLMIPKTCAYIWMIAMGLELLF